MLIKLIEQYSSEYNKLAHHPLQSWEWGEFRKKTGVEIFRFGEFVKDKPENVYQMTVHKIPKTPYFIGYIPKSNLPTKELLKYLEGFAKKKKVIFIKFEPNIECSLLRGGRSASWRTSEVDTLVKYKLVESPRPLFTKYTFQIDLRQTEEELLSVMKSKTRYNLRLAEKKGVKINEDNSEKSFKTYLSLQKETTKRQKFYAHNEKYHQALWNTLHPKGIAYILNAVYEKKTLVSWMVFLFNDVLYYPYGGSTNEYRNLMPSNLMLWEAIRWGKTKGAKMFDLWGALGSNPDPKDPWYGFHKFKEGYGGRLIEFIGSYDFVINPLLYHTYNITDSIRWKILHLLH